MEEKIEFKVLSVCGLGHGHILRKATWVEAGTARNRPDGGTCRRTDLENGFLDSRGAAKKFSAVQIALTIDASFAAQKLFRASGPLENPTGCSNSTAAAPSGAGRPRRGPANRAPDRCLALLITMLLMWRIWQ
jgi:hypothetical protein